MTENIHGKYADAMKHLEYIANREEVDQSAVNKLLALGHHLPKQEPKYTDALTREMMKSTGE